MERNVRPNCTVWWKPIFQRRHLCRIFKFSWESRSHNGRSNKTSPLKSFHVNVFNTVYEWVSDAVKKDELLNADNSCYMEIVPKHKCLKQIAIQTNGLLFRSVTLSCKGKDASNIRFYKFWVATEGADASIVIHQGVHEKELIHGGISQQGLQWFFNRFTASIRRENICLWLRHEEGGITLPSDAKCISCSSTISSYSSCVIIHHCSQHWTISDGNLIVHNDTICDDAKYKMLCRCNGYLPLLG